MNRPLTSTGATATPATPSGGDFAAITAGRHCYSIPKSHALKLSAEVTHYPDAQADSASIVRAPDKGVGLRPDGAAGR